MAITNGYLTLNEFKSYLSITDENDDTELELAVEAASRAIDDWCGRRFYSASETRYYTAATSSRVWIDDLASVTTLKTDHGGDGTFETTWDAADYVLNPRNAALGGQPYTQIVTAPNGSRSFPSVRDGIEIVGTFGWPAVPPVIKKACVIQAARLFQVSKDGGGGLADFGNAGGSRYLERSTEMLIRPYRVPVVA